LETDSTVSALTQEALNAAPVKRRVLDKVDKHLDGSGLLMNRYRVFFQ